MAVIKLSPHTFLDTSAGIIITRQQAEKIISQAVLRQKNLTVHDTVSRIVGRDTQVINLNLQGLNQNIPPTRGFLVKVYLSSSDGLQRMYKNTIIDPADQSIVRGSFNDYIELDLDV